MSEPIVVTGVGIVSAAGWGAAATERSVIEMRSGLGPLQLFESVPAPAAACGSASRVERGE